MKKQEQTNIEQQEVKKNELYGCNKCWSNYIITKNKELTKNMYIMENIYFSLPQQNQVIAGRVMRCQTCGDYKKVAGKIFIFNYNYALLRDCGVSLEDIRKALQSWPIDKRIVLDPSKELKYNNFEPKPNETFTEYRKRYNAMVKKLGKYI